MADMYTRTARTNDFDQFAADANALTLAPVIDPLMPVQPGHAGDYFKQRLPDVYGETAPKVGSPLDTLYGVDSESYLTDDQRKLARQIQGKFDASMNRRDRELARYAAPRLSSFVEDEAIARAMAQARGLNYREKEDSTAVRPGTQPGRGPAGNPLAPRRVAGGPPADPTVDEDKATNTQWSRILTGLASLAPLLFGKDAYGEFLNKGAIQWAKEKLFGPDAATGVSDQAFERMVQSGTLPSDGVVQYNPITGLPMGMDPQVADWDLDAYGPGSGWGNDLIAQPFTPDYSDFYGDGSQWADWTPESGGDFLDLFGGV